MYSILTKILKVLCFLCLVLLKNNLIILSSVNILYKTLISTEHV